MSRINLLQSGMTGVDLKSNPLLLGAKQKLRFATNMVFEEGVLRSRPGFRYVPLCCSGQFQGAVDFRPTRGLSYQPHSSESEGIALVVRGSLYFNGEKISGNVFKEKGPVNLFQAENYLIIQNIESDTYWWDGVTLTKSPGMNPVDFAEIETPVHEMEIVIPVADITPCGGNNDYLYTFIVIDAVSEERISYSAYQLFVNENIAYEGISDEQGVFALTPESRDYTYDVRHTGYYPVENVFLQVDPSDRTIYVRMTPITDICLIGITDNLIDEGDVEMAEFTVTNNGNVDAIITGINSSVPLLSVDVPFPHTLAPLATVTVNVVAVSSLVGGTFELNTSCGTYVASWLEVGGGGSDCGFVVESEYENITGIIYRINNTGGSTLNVTAADVTGGVAGIGGFEPTSYVYLGEIVELPVEVAPGEYLSVSQLGNVFEDGGGYTLTLECGGETFSSSGEIEL